MKKDLLCYLSLILMSSTLFAANTLPLNINTFSFNPVPWHATLANGDFSLQNFTKKTQYVQVVIETGNVYVHTSNGSCRGEIDAIKGPFSIICKLAPNDRLNGDIDYSQEEDATGTYQIDMDK